MPKRKGATLGRKSKAQRRSQRALIPRPEPTRLPDWARWGAAVLAALAITFVLSRVYREPTSYGLQHLSAWSGQLTAVGVAWLALTLLGWRFLPDRLRVWVLVAVALLGTVGASLWMRTATAWFSALFIIALSWVLGAALWPWLRVRTRPAVGHYLKAALGLQVQSLLGYLWSVLHIWSLPLALGSASALAVVSHLLWRARRVTGEAEAARPAAPLPLIEWMMASLLVILSVVMVLLASLPDTGFDAIWSHLMVAQDIAQNRYLPDTDVWHTLVPHAVHMIFGLAVALGGTAAATLMNLVLGIVAVAGTVAFGARLYSRATGLAAAMFLVGTPLLLALGTTAYVDTGAVLYALALTMCVVEFADDSSMGWSALVGANLGMLTGIKDVGLMFAPVVAVVVVVAAVRGRKATKWVRPVALGVGVFAVTGLSWILRTWLITRNPVFPLMNSLFHSPYWGEGNLNFGTFGVPRTPVNTVLTPYWVTVSTHHFVEGADGCAGGLLLLIWPLWLVGPSTFGRRRWLLAALALAFLVEQWTLVQYLRYSLVVWPLLALLAAGGLVSVWENPRWRPAMRGSLAAAVALVCAVALLGWAARTYRRDGYAVLHPENPGAYLASHLSGYRAYYWTATHVPPDAKILADPGIAASAYAQHHLVPYWASTLTDAGVRLTRIGTAWYVNGVDAAALGDRHNIQYLLTTGNRAEELANRTVGPTSYTVQYTDGTLGLVRMEPRS